MPHLEGTGSPRGGAPIALALGNAAANMPAWFVVGVGRVDLPLFGGTLIPQPDVVLGPLLLSAGGTAALATTWPAVLPPGIVVTVQAWVADASGPQGFTASNALLGIGG